MPALTLHTAAAHQRGASLITVMLILIIVSALGIGAVQISMMSERSARNDRDMQVAWQAAEAALMDAEFDIRGPLPSTRRDAVFGDKGLTPKRTLFAADGCNTSAAGTAVGLCDAVSDIQAAAGIRPKWLQANLEQTGNTTDTTEFGQFTGQEDYPSGSGVRSAQPPRYVIELLPDKSAARDLSGPTPTEAFIYRVTAMGFGPREDIRAVAQMLLRP